MSRQSIFLISQIKTRTLIRVTSTLVIGLGLSGCSTLSMSDFGIGSSEPQQTATQNTSAPQQQISTPQRTTASQAKQKETGLWNRMTGWFGSDKKPATAVKGDNLTVTQAQTTQQVTNASLRAAQDATQLNAPLASTPQVNTGPVKLASAQNVSVPNVQTPQIQVAQPSINAPQTLSSKSPLPTTSNVNTKQLKTAATTVAGTQAQQPQIKTLTNPPQKEGLFDRIGSWFSSDKKPAVQKPVLTQPQSTVNGVATASKTTQQKALTPTQTLRLSRQKSSGAQVSSQGLTPYVPNTAPVKVADSQIKTNSISAPQKVSAPRVTTPKVAVKPLAPATPQKIVQRAPAKSKAPVQEQTSYVVTPETYKKTRTPAKPVQVASRQPGKSALLASAAPSQSAYKFYFNPGSSNLAPHHIAQLKGLASQAIARQRDVVVLGTSNPGGEAGAGASQLALQNIATARAMEAAKNLQKFGVPSHKIKMRIAQSTTPTEVGTGGNSTLASMSARRVEVSIQ